MKNSIIPKYLFQHQLLTTGKLSSGHPRERDKWSLNKCSVDSNLLTILSPGTAESGH